MATDREDLTDEEGCEKGKPTEKADRNDGPPKQPAPDGGWGWWVVLASTVALVILGGLEKSRGVIYPEIIERYETSSATAAWVISMTGLLRLCGGPLASALSNRFGIRVVVMVGSVILSLSYVVSAFSVNIIQLFFTYGILGGIGQMCCYAPSVIIVGLYFDKRRALSAGLSSAGLGIGTFIVPPVVELMLDNMGFTNAFFIIAGIGLNVCVCGSIFRSLELHWKITDIARRRQRRKLKEKGQNELAETDMDNAETAEDTSSRKLLEIVEDKSNKPSENKSRLAELRKFLCGDSSTRKKQKLFDFSLLKDIPFLSFCLTLTLYTMAAQIGQVFVASMARERGVSRTNSALLLSILGICDTIGRVISGVLFDRPGIKPHRQYIYNVFLFLIATCSCMFPLAYDFAAFAGVSAAFGFVTGTYIAQKSVIIVDLVGADKLIHSFGMIICFQGIGFLVGPTLSGVLIDKFKRYDLSFYFAGLVSLIAGFVFMFGNCYGYRRRKRESLEETGHEPA